MSVLPIDDSSSSLTSGSGDRRRTPTEIVVGSEGSAGQVVRLPPPIMSVGSQRGNAKPSPAPWIPPEITIGSQRESDSKLLSKKPSDTVRSSIGGASWLPSEISVSSSGVGQRLHPGSHIVQPDLINRRDNHNFYPRRDNNFGDGRNPLGASLNIRDPKSERIKRSPTNAPRVSRAKTTAIQFLWKPATTTQSTLQWTQTSSTTASHPRTSIDNIYESNLRIPYRSVGVSIRNETDRSPFNNAFDVDRRRDQATNEPPRDFRRPYNPLDFWPASRDRINSGNSDGNSRPNQDSKGPRAPDRTAWITEISEDSRLPQQPLDKNRESKPASNDNHSNRYPIGRTPILNQGINNHGSYSRTFNESTTWGHNHSNSYHRHAHRDDRLIARGHHPHTLHDAVDLSRPVDLPRGTFDRQSLNPSKIPDNMNNVRQTPSIHGDRRISHSTASLRNSQRLNDNFDPRHGMRVALNSAGMFFFNNL